LPFYLSNANSSTMKLATLILAAGKGTRMKSDLPKVLHPVLGKPMLGYVIELAREVASEKTVAIIGHGRDLVKAQTAEYGIAYAIQDPQLGTGHAVMQAEQNLNGFAGNVLVLSGDVPLLKAETVRALLAEHEKTNAVATVLTTILDNPFGYGRIIRNAAGFVTKTVEQKDASDAEKEIKEINSGIYVFEKENLFRALKRITNHNAQKEYYLPDVFNIFFSEQKKIAAVVCKNPDEIRGVNTPEQLAEVEAVLR
jgi:UDP-N-acetylglucosamine pyrophosphorylase